LWPQAEGGEIDPRLKKEKVAIQVLQAFMGTVLFGRCMRNPRSIFGIEGQFSTLLERDTVSGQEQKP